MSRTEALPIGSQRARRTVHHALEAGLGHSLQGTLIGGAMILLAVANAIAGALLTVPYIKADYGSLIHALDVGSALVFGGEYALRLWSCIESPFFARRSSWRERLHYAAQPAQLIDLLTFLPTCIGLATGVDMWAAMILRFAKIARYSPALHTLGRVIAAERAALFGALVIMVGLVLFASTVMYFIERDAQPNTFGSIPAAAWWAVITLSTIGYGDAVPVTPLGKAFGGVLMIAGLAAFALPFGIITAGFSREATRRDFMVSWLLVARVPLFSGLDAAAVSQIITLLHSRTYEAGDVIVWRGAAGDRMYFLVSGDVMVETDGGDVPLKEGDFFGEMALLEHRPRSSTVRATTRVRALVLDREDLERLARRHPAIMARIREVASARRRSSSGKREQD